MSPDKDIQLTDEELEKDPSKDILDVIDDEDVKKELQTEHARKLHFKNKYQDTAKKLEEATAALAKLNGNPPAPKDQPKNDEVNNRLSNLEMSEQKRQFASINGFDAEETDKIFAYAKGVDKAPQDVLDDPFLKNAIAVHRQTKANANAIPTPSGSTIKVQGKNWSEMTNDERKKSYNDVWKK